MKECRKERQKRLMEVYNHLRQHFGVHTKTDLAKVLDYGRTSISAAINGKEKYLTDDLFETICDKYKNVFNIAYLLEGEGELLTPEEIAKSSEIEKAANPSINESTADLIELYAQRIRLVDDLRQSLKEELAEVRAIKEDLHQVIYDFRDATYLLNTALSKINGNELALDKAAEN